MERVQTWSDEKQVLELVFQFLPAPVHVVGDEDEGRILELAPEVPR